MDEAALGDMVSCKPTSIHLQRVQGVTRGHVGVGSVGLHLLDAKERAACGDKGNTQGQWRVVHPESVPARCFKDEQHAAVRAQKVALHESLCPCLWGAGDLNLNTVPANDKLGILPPYGMCCEQIDEEWYEWRAHMGIINASNCLGKNGLQEWVTRLAGKIRVIRLVR